MGPTEVPIEILSFSTYILLFSVKCMFLVYNASNFLISSFVNTIDIFCGYKHGPI